MRAHAVCLYIDFLTSAHVTESEILRFEKREKGNPKHCVMRIMSEIVF